MGRSQIYGVVAPVFLAYPLRWRLDCSARTARTAELFGPCHGAAVVVSNLESQYLE
jgi:hypothetical protein